MVDEHEDRRMKTNHFIPDVDMITGKFEKKRWKICLEHRLELVVFRKSNSHLYLADEIELLMQGSVHNISDVSTRNCLLWPRSSLRKT